MKKSAKVKLDKEHILEEIASFLAEYGAKEVRVFGSYARGETTAESDIDVLVEFEGRKSLLEIIGMEQELSEKLGVKIDLLTEKAISPYIRENIRDTVVILPK
ncbi:MAG: nucleotidyltransferase family protein [Candidatus Korarchaeota archaeon]|nr:nucleotidyltransferase family protein [Candidatus Korarchaeota archaeon]NIU82663.1 hypothetical protein [Candidatus Thorarchaeota archaeon]NIW14655.1 hypothetical protein [Candidatus Thorarchaeota archaeon]NIW52731.1 hypothetical protein [Candidatus Korarchaeota archaeon]